MRVVRTNTAIRNRKTGFLNRHDRGAGFSKCQLPLCPLSSFRAVQGKAGFVRMEMYVFLSYVCAFMCVHGRTHCPCFGPLCSSCLNMPRTFPFIQIFLIPLLLSQNLHHPSVPCLLFQGVPSPPPLTPLPSFFFLHADLIAAIFLS